MVFAGDSLSAKCQGPFLQLPLYFRPTWRGLNVILASSPPPILILRCCYGRLSSRTTSICVNKCGLTEQKRETPTFPSDRAFRCPAHIVKGTTETWSSDLRSHRNVHKLLIYEAHPTEIHKIQGMCLTLGASLWNGAIRAAASVTAVTKATRLCWILRYRWSMSLLLLHLQWENTKRWIFLNYSFIGIFIF